MFLKKREHTPKISYFICSNRRAGSNLVCDVLRQTNIAGIPVEYFNPFPFIANYRKEYIGAKGDVDYIDKVIAASTTPNGVFGTKIHAYQIPVLLSKIKAEERVTTANISLKEIIESRFYNLQYVWVKRENKVRQAISLYRAFHDGIWWKFINQPPMFKQGGGSMTELLFDFDKIQECLTLVENDDTAWGRFFVANNIQPLQLVYETFSKDYESATRKVLEHLGLPLEISIPTPQTQKQADKTTDTWEVLFLKERELRDEKTYTGHEN